MTATPEGRTQTLAESATISWARDLSGVATHTTASGDTAMVELAFEAAAGETYTFSDLVSIVFLERAQPAALAAQARPPRARRLRRARRAKCRLVAQAVGDGHRDRWRSLSCSVTYVRCSSTSSAAPIRARRSRSLPWDSRAPDTMGTSSGTRIPGCSRRSCSRIRTSRDPSSIFALAR